MKKKLLMAFGLMVSLLSSCCDLDTGASTASDGQDDATKYHLRIKAAIGDSLSGATTYSWDKDATIGVNGQYADGSTWFANGKFAFQETSSLFESNPKFYYKDKGVCSLSAYYPYAETAVEQIKFSVPESGIAEDYKDVDFLYATGTTEYSTIPNLVFYHKMTRVVFNIIAGDGYTGEENDGKASLAFLNGAFAFTWKASGTFDTTTGIVTADENTSTLSMTGVDCIDEGVPYCKTYTLLLPPQGVAGTILSFTDANGYTLTTTLSEASSFTYWQAGNTYIYNVVCSKEALGILSADIAPWIENNAEYIYPN